MSHETRKLWVPGQGMELHDEYPVPSQAELIEYWQTYTPGDIVEAPGVYGCLKLSATPPRVYASIDVCEVLRETYKGFRAAVGARTNSQPGSVHHQYREGLSLTNDEDITSVLQVLMSHAWIKPVESIDEISTILLGWRKQGVYVVANTSTLPGCEKGTIDFFKSYLPDCLDGILLPRNHDGSLPLTKGHAAANTIARLSPQQTDVVAIHIDDAPHHNIAFRQQMRSLTSEGRIATFQPEYPSHLPRDVDGTITSTPLEAFYAADRFIRAQI